MTARVQLVELRPGDVVRDLVTAGTVAEVTGPTRSGAVRIDYEFGGAFIGPSTYTVTTTREADL